jgi:hypothetical protein
MLVQAAIPEAGIEAFHKRILRWFAGLYETEFDAGPLRPEEHGLADQFGSVVHYNGFWLWS